MANLKDIRSRISSVKNTQQITRAMKMVSAAKLKKAQDRIVNMRPYAKKLLSVIADIAYTHRINHPLLSNEGEVKKLLTVVVTSDRGLCGGFNANVQKFIIRYHKENKEKYSKLDYIFIGRKGSDFFKSRGIVGIKTILNMAKDISYTLSADIAKEVISAFSKGEYDEIRFVYNEFKSAIAQEVVCETILPIDVTQGALSDEDSIYSDDMIFEPAPEQIIDDLLDKHFAIHVFRCLSESVAAEHGARMTAMENSTNNASDMIRGLTLTYNKLRQASITTELIEITSGAEALNG